jgi:hypothetical protein
MHPGVANGAAVKSSDEVQAAVLPREVVAQVLEQRRRTMRFRDAAHSGNCLEVGLAFGMDDLKGGNHV